VKHFLWSFLDDERHSIVIKITPDRILCRFLYLPLLVVSSALRLYSGSSRRRKSAACPNSDMVGETVWLYHSPRKGVISSFKLFLFAFATCEERGGSAPCGYGPFFFKKSFLCRQNLYTVIRFV